MRWSIETLRKAWKREHPETDEERAERWSALNRKDDERTAPIESAYWRGLRTGFVIGAVFVFLYLIDR
jgi:hypothetical protein